MEVRIAPEARVTDQALDLKLERSGDPQDLLHGRLKRRVTQIRRVFDEYSERVRNSMESEPHAYIQVLAAVIR